MGIQTKENSSRRPFYPYVGELKYDGGSVSRILFVTEGTGWNLETGLFHEHIQEYKYNPIIHTVTFDLS